MYLLFYKKIIVTKKVKDRKNKQPIIFCMEIFNFHANMSDNSFWQPILLISNIFL
jgi:hypothetical protein